MISEIQREVAVHLLANALRNLRVNDSGQPGQGSDDTDPPARARRRRRAEDEYMRGMLDMLNGLYGQAYANELLRAARALERSTSTY